MPTERAAPAAGRLDGRRTVITGAARGIGAAIAARFAAEGASVALMDRPGEALDDAAARIGALPVPCDLADPEVTRSATSAAVEQLGGLDILVNNAGVFSKVPLLELSTDEWDLTFAVNTRAMLVTMQVAAAAMIAAGTGGAVVNMASMGGKLGEPGQAHYAASKAAVISLTRVAAMELGPHGVRVNCICPGYVLTDMGAATRTAEMVDGWSAKSPLGRCAEPDDVAAMALFLASDESRYCTGQAMNVSGGMVMH